MSLDEELTGPPWLGSGGRSAAPRYPLSGGGPLCGSNLPWLGATWGGRAATPAFGALSDHNTISAAPVPHRRPTNYRAPSRPGELHPEPLTDPCLSLSTHTARATY